MTIPEAVPVIICTKDRPDDVMRAVRSLLSDEQQRGEVIVIDQSEHDGTDVAIRQFGDARLRYVRSRTRGKGGALNEGLVLARARFVAFTDDDCEASPGWAERLVAPMHVDDRIALTFSRVAAPPHDLTLGYIPANDFPEDRILRHPLAMRKGWGLGAGMAIRREAILDIGGFDATMGPGGVYPSADDFDLELRLLLLGWHVCENSTTSVLHHGFRTLEAGRAHAARDWVALGASCAKAVRVKHVQVSLLAACVVWTNLVRPAFHAAIRLKRPPLRRLTAFASGLWSGSHRRVDRRNILYMEDGAQRGHP
jgi:hypothetical protein